MPLAFLKLRGVAFTTWPNFRTAPIQHLFQNYEFHCIQMANQQIYCNDAKRQNEGNVLPLAKSIIFYERVCYA
ncbi:hypothetical protein A6K76_15655 [Caryophanon latum]|uniref:Uncharacterized protein n=1 Tax=Caryophanon latum TaxID=33977 RepID=A0A1C0YB25_9BACL|nr:hypothetical protein A6K76_15655 [Caryophanon latum]